MPIDYLHAIVLKYHQGQGGSDKVVHLTAMRTIINWIRDAVEKTGKSGRMVVYIPRQTREAKAILQA